MVSTQARTSRSVPSRARHLRRFNSPGQAQRFLSVHGLVRTRFRGGRHLVRAVHHRELRRRSFLIGGAVTTTVKVTNLFNQAVQQHIFGDLLRRTVVGDVTFTL